MFLLILESIGTPELILIGIVALIFLGPRKLPQIARTIGKTMADLRNTTNEFKSTWQREVDFEDEVSALRTGELPENGSSAVARDASVQTPRIIEAPDIKPVQTDLFADADLATKPDPEDAAATDDELADKRTWL